MPFAGNQIPVSCFDKAAVALTNDLPAAQNGCGQVTYGIVTTGDDDQGVLRMDWLQSSKNSIFGRYYVVNYRNPSVYTDNILTTTQVGNLESTNAIALGDTYSFTPTLLNSAHALSLPGASTIVTPRRTPRIRPPSALTFLARRRLPFSRAFRATSELAAIRVVPRFST